MEIITLEINKLKPYEKNAKQHPKEQIEQIKKSIEQFGMNDPIAVWGEDNTIVEGHGRLEALKQLGYKEVPCIRLDHLSDEERKAYTLAHNKLTMNSDFDFDILTQELDDILNINMSDFGFDIDLENQDNFIDDLLVNEYSGGAVETNKFSMTFVFEKEYQNTLEEFIANNSKDAVVKIIKEGIANA